MVSSNSNKSSVKSRSVTLILKLKNWKGLTQRQPYHSWIHRKKVRHYLTTLFIIFLSVQESYPGFLWILGSSGVIHNAPSRLSSWGWCNKKPTTELTTALTTVTGHAKLSIVDLPEVNPKFSGVLCFSWWSLIGIRKMKRAPCLTCWAVIAAVPGSLFPYQRQMTTPLCPPDLKSEDAAYTRCHSTPQLGDHLSNVSWKQLFQIFTSMFFRPIRIWDELVIC